MVLSNHPAVLIPYANEHSPKAFNQSVVRNLILVVHSSLLHTLRKTECVNLLIAFFSFGVKQCSIHLVFAILLFHITCTINVILQVMYARQVDQRSAVFQKAIEVGDAYVLRTKVID